MSKSPLVSAEWLLDNISAPDIRVIDASYYPAWTAEAGAGQAAYSRGHIPGAVYFDIDEVCDSTSDLPHMMPDSIKFSSRVRKMGVGDGNRIVVYDANDFFASARVWWMFRQMGHEDIQVLNGGLRAWQAAGGELEDLPPVVTGGRHFTPRVRSDLIRSMQQMRQAVKAKDSAILDARPAGRFAGTEAEPRADLSSGHMPGSINVPSNSLVGPDGKLRDGATLEKALGTFVSASAVATCGSGVSAAIIALALAELGNYDVAIYDGSWSEWAANPDNEIQKTKA